MKYILTVLLFVPALLSAQTEAQRWGKADISYQVKSPYTERNYGIEKASVTDMFVSSFAHAYWILISDVDGDNCPFSPSCSSFFVQSVKETNIFQGTLMFADRLTRDTNFFYRQYHYPYASNGRLYDVPSSYKLDAAEIIYHPPSVLVRGE